MIRAIVFFLVLSAPPFFLAVFRGKRFEETIAVTTGCLILFLFVCGIPGLLKTGVGIILGMTVAFFSASLAILIRKKQLRSTLTVFCTPAFAAFCLVFAALLYLHAGRMLHEWDEFTHWGDVVKAMVNIGDFSTNPDSDVLFRSYVPGMALFQYLFEEIALVFPDRVFIDWRLYFSYHLLAFIFLLPFFSLKKWATFLPAFTVITCAAVSPAFMTEDSGYLTSIYVDGFVGLLAGTGFALLFLKKRTGMNIAHLLVICSMLVLSKDVGLVFAIALGLAFLIPELAGKPGTGRKENRNRLLVLLALTVAAIEVPRLLWEIRIQYDQAEVRFRQPIDPGVLLRVITGEDQSYLAGIPGAVFSRLLTGKAMQTGIGGFPVQYPLLAVVLTGLLAAARKAWSGIDPEGRKQRAAASRMMILTLVIWCLGMPLLYMFRFDRSSAEKLASFDRYMSIVFDCFIVMVWLLFACMKQERFRSILKTAGISLLVTVMMLNPTAVQKNLTRESVTENSYVQGRFRNIILAMRLLANGETKNVWIIAQATDGFDYWPVRYATRPCSGGGQAGWSLSATDDALYGGDRWTVRISAEEWQEQLKYFDYVLICYANDSFREDYGSLFEETAEIEDRTIFEVNHETGLLVQVY